MKENTMNIRLDKRSSYPLKIATEITDYQGGLDLPDFVQ